MILTIGPGGCGFTFLNWTICYLRGDRSYIDLDGNEQPVDINPLQQSTAHGFQKDHLKIETRGNRLSQAHHDSIVYITPASQQDFLQLLALEGKKIVFDNRKHAKELLARSFMTMGKCDHGIHLYLDELERKYPPVVARWTLLDHARQLVQYYQVDTCENYLLVDYEDIFRDLDLRLPKIFEWLDLSINKDRWEHWHAIYTDYRHRNRDFVTRFTGGPEGPVDHALKKAIFKEIYSWTHGGYRSINQI